MEGRIPFDEEVPRLAGHVAAVQSALRAALDGIASDESGARACGRALGLTRSFGWSIWNMAFAPDVPAALRAMPGDKGWRMLTEGLVRRGCPPKRIAALEGAVRALRSEMQARKLHPTLLRSIASGALDSEVEARRMRAARRKSREAAEILYGIRASAACSAIAVGPPDHEGAVDTVGIALFEGLHRLRPSAEWPIFEGQLNSGNPGFHAAQLRPSKVHWAIDHLCTPGTVGTALRPSRSSDHLVAFVDTGSTDVRGIRAAFAQRALRCGRVTAPAGGGEHPHLSMIVTVPTKVATFDVLLHKRVPMHADPVGALYGPPDPWPAAGDGHSLTNRVEAKRLSLDSVVEVPKPGAAPAGIVALRAPWDELLALAADGLGAPLAEFRHYRLTVKDPPMHGRILVRWVP
jgi:hypothetical protein